ncbi:MAG: HDIG domain-containing protein [Proteobacteria bacterium]|nr:HDIG domain-containing protein [Pseudomonadota bacterium]
MRSPRARNYATALSGTVLALAFATFGLAGHFFETWFSSLEVKAGKEAPVTVRLPARYFRITMLRNEFHYLAATSSRCPHLVPRGTQLKQGEECTGLVKAFESARRSKSPFRYLGIFIFYFAVGLLLTIFMRHRTMGRARLLRAQLTVFGLLFLLIIGAKAILLMTALPAVVIPVVTVPLLSAYFFRKQISFVIALVSAMVTVSLINFNVEFFIIYLATGMAVVSFRGNRQRAWIQLKGGISASWVAILATVITTLVFSGTLGIYDDLTEHLDPRYSLWISALLGGLGSGVLAWLLTPLVGMLVGEVSRSTLLDLQDLDQRLLRLISDKAPGTWEHSRAMANLAEASANAIGGNALLARIGAYYHDIGKSGNSEYFIENQAGGPNPHDDLTPEESARRILRHVLEGTRILRQEGLPEDVVEFCYSHHGTSVLEYFWHKNMAEDNPDDLTEADFSYPGHKPTTRETGIIMVVDAIEAAARTVDAPDKIAFQNLVQKIVFSKLSQGQLDETGLTLADLRIVANTLIDTLVNMYHARIKYPWQTGDTGTSVRVTDDTDAESEVVELKDPTPPKVNSDTTDSDAAPKNSTNPAPKKPASSRPSNDRNTIPFAHETDDSNSKKK